MIRSLLPKLRPATYGAQRRFVIPNARFDRPRFFTPSAIRSNSYGQYQRFSRSAQSPNRNLRLAGVIIGITGIVYVSNLEKVPLSGRTRFNIVSKEREADAGRKLYASILHEYQHQILPSNHPACRQVGKVLSRLIPKSGLEDMQWEAYVVSDPQANAFVIPGGKVFVFSGILEVANTEDRLAAVLGHEIGHVVASHAAERMSQWMIVLGAIYLAAISIGAPDLLSTMLADLVFFKPASRKQEAEADYIGLILMSQACYNPKEAVEMWRRMQIREKMAPPQFLSTHPSNVNRIASLQNWIPEAMDHRRKSGCSTMLDYVQDFKSAFTEDIW